MYEGVLWLGDYSAKNKLKIAWTYFKSEKNWKQKVGNRTKRQETKEQERKNDKTWPLEQMMNGYYKWHKIYSISWSLDWGVQHRYLDISVSSIDNDRR